MSSNAGKRCRVAVLISGNGSNLQALIDACELANFPAEIALVISNRPEAYGLKRAQAANIPSHVIRHNDYGEREAFDAAMHAILKEHDIDLVCLAGFMRLLSEGFVEKWHDKMMNIHPSLLPAFKGVDVHQRALDAGVRVSGCTVHFVRAAMDVGPIIVQAAVPVLADDTPDSLAQRIHTQEHRIYPMALRWFAQGSLRVENERVRYTNGHNDDMKKGEDVLISPLIL